MPRLRLLLLLLLLSAVALAACGGAGDSQSVRAPARVDLALDFTPNAVHAPIFGAQRIGADRARGVDLRIRRPGAGPDALKLVASGRLDVGVLDIHDLAIARSRGVDVVAIGALIRRPLAALVARSDVARPRDLAGRTVGVSGLPSDPAFLRAIVEDDGGDFDAIKRVTIGFNSVGSLISGKVDAAPVFWNAEGVALRRRGVPVREFRVDDYGAPPYPEVVLVTSRATLQRRRADLRRTLQAIDDGLKAVLADEPAAVRQIVKEAGTPDMRLGADQLRAVRGAYAPGLALDRAVLEEWAAFDARIGIVDRRPDVDEAFDFAVAPGG